MRFLLVGIAVLCGDAHRSRMHRGQDAAISESEESSVELRQQLQESQQEDDTNEAIIEQLLGKEGKLANQTVALKKEIVDLKKKVSEQPKVSATEFAALKEHDSKESAQVRALSAQLAAEKQKETEEFKDVASIKSRNEKLEHEALQTSKEGHKLRQSLSQTKLALLQSMKSSLLKTEDAGSGSHTKLALLQNAESQADAGADTVGSAVLSSAEVQSLSQKLFSQSAALSNQVQVLSKKLQRAQEKERQAKIQAKDVEDENDKLRDQAQDRSEANNEAKEVLEQSYQRADVGIAQALHELRSEEKGLRENMHKANTKSGDMQKVKKLESENQRLKLAGNEVMQKYDLLQKAFERQQRRVHMLDQEVRSVAEADIKSPRVFLEKTSHLHRPALPTHHRKPRLALLEARAPVTTKASSKPEVAKVEAKAPVAKAKIEAKKAAVEISAKAPVVNVEAKAEVKANAAHKKAAMMTTVAKVHKQAAMHKQLTVLHAKLDFSKAIVALDKDLKTKVLVQAGAHGIQDPCASLECGALRCPAGFTEEKVPGHCCGYCVNPNIKVEHAAKGASGEFGGKPSTFCNDVWCFPTMCSKEHTNPTTTNGQCCPACPAL